MRPNLNKWATALLIFRGNPAKFFTRVLARLYPTASGCLEWDGAKWANGYGKVTLAIDGRQTYFPVHRLIYLMTHPYTDFDLDHLCRNKNCANIHHLQEVTRGENIKRGRRFKKAPEEYWDWAKKEIAKT